jgi:hypothetical protein
VFKSFASKPGKSPKWKLILSAAGGAAGGRFTLAAFRLWVGAP